MKIQLILLCFFLFFTSCLDKSSTRPPVGVEPEIREIKIPDFLAFDQTYIIEVRAGDPQGNRDIKFVTLYVFYVGNTEPVLFDTLRDDGGYLDPENGDVVAGDGIFTSQILIESSGTSGGLLRFVVIAYDNSGHYSKPFEKQITSEVNFAPKIITVTGPNYLPAGFKTETFQVSVSDSNGAADITMVSLWVAGRGLDEIELFDDGSHGDHVAGDQIYTRTVDSSFSARKKGVTEVKFGAKDRFNATSQPFTWQVNIENTAPHIFNLIIPDSLKLPASGDNSFYLKVNASDPQSLADIKIVGLVTQKPDGSYSSGANPDNPLPLVDNGTSGDDIPNDGIYSLKAYISYQNDRGTYTFIFQAEDWVANKSDSLVHKLVVY